VDNRFLRLIEALVRYDVRFIVVGGVAAVLQRVVVNTQDFDLVHDRSEDNVRKLLLVIDELGATYRDDPRGLRPYESHLSGPGNQLLSAGNSTCWDPSTGEADTKTYWFSSGFSGFIS
jgi:hypothetical protein